MGRAVSHPTPTKAQIAAYLEKLQRTDPSLWANVVADPKTYRFALLCAVSSRLRRAKEYPARNARRRAQRRAERRGQLRVQGRGTSNTNRKEVR